MFTSWMRTGLLCVLLQLAGLTVQAQTGGGTSDLFVFPQAAVGPVPPVGRYVIDLRVANPGESRWTGRLSLLDQARLQPMENLQLNGVPVADAGRIEVALEAGESRVLRIESEATQVQIGILTLRSESPAPQPSVVPSFTYRLLGNDGRVIDLIAVPPSEPAATLRAVVSRSMLESFEFGLALVRAADLSGDAGGTGQPGGEGPDLLLVLTFFDSTGARQVREAEVDFGPGEPGLQLARLLREFFADSFEAGLLEVRSNVGPVYALLIGFGNRPDFASIQNGVAPLFAFRRNAPPVVDAGNSRIVFLSPDGSITVDLAGEVFDPEEDPVSVRWRVVSAPAGAGVFFANRNIPVTTVTLDRPGTYVLRLIANDGTSEGASDVTIRVNPNRAPTVEAGPDQSLNLSPMGRVVVQLEGTASDPDGHPLTVTWSATSSPAAGSFSFQDRNRLDTTVTLFRSGSYRLRLTADDGELTAFDELTITVNPNLPPTVSAGPDITASLDSQGRATVGLNGAVSDADGDLVTTLWSVVAAPMDSTVAFADRNAVETTATFTVPGAYVLRLTASDGEFEAGDEVTVNIQGRNQPPTVDAGPDQVVAVGPDGTATAQLNGVVADDGLPAGSTLQVQWSQFRGPAGVVFANRDSAVTTVRLPMLGEYVLRLTASDGELIRTDRVTIVVVAANQAPLVSAGPDRSVALTPSGTVAVQLEGSVSDDGLPTGGTLTAQWTRISGPAAVVFANANLPATTATFSLAGVYVLRLTATDGQLTAFDEVTIAVGVANQPPAVNAGEDQVVSLRAVGSVTVALEGAVSDDGLPSPPNLTVQWLVGIGPAPASFSAPNSPVTTVTFTAAGTYVLRLRATDGQLASSDEVTILVLPNQAPVVDAGGNQTVNLAPSGGITVILEGQVSDAQGDPLTILWSLVEGPAGAGVVFANPNSPTTTASFTAAGSYRLRLTASDGALTAFDEVVITVNPAP